MIKSKLYQILAVVLTASVVACGSTQKSETASRSMGDDMVIDAANQQLAKVPAVGYPPFATTMPTAQFDQYGETAATVAKNVVNSMPPGYVLQVTGHANQHPSKSAAYTKSLSLQRAKYVYNYFIKKGIDKNKMTYVGVGNAEPDPNLSHSDNRRVTFKIVKQ
ncbi:MAG: OmpA family protein [Turneriella sp.]